MIGCLAAAFAVSLAGSASAATLAPTAASFGKLGVGEVSAPKAIVVTAEVTDVLLPLTVATTGQFQQTNDCPSGIGFLTTSSCTINVRFAPNSGGAHSGTLSTTTLLVGGPTASLTGTGVSDTGASAAAKKCKKKKGKKKKGKRGKKGAAAAKKKKGKKCKKKRKKKGKRK